MFGGVLETSRKGREVRNLLAVLVVSLHRAIAQPQSKSGIRWLIEPTFCEPGSGDGCPIAPFDRIDLIVILFSQGACVWINRAHQDDEWICGRLHDVWSTLVQLLAKRDVLQVAV